MWNSALRHAVNHPVPKRSRQGTKGHKDGTRSPAPAHLGTSILHSGEQETGSTTNGFTLSKCRKVVKQMAAFRRRWPTSRATHGRMRLGELIPRFVGVLACDMICQKTRSNCLRPDTSSGARARPSDRCADDFAVGSTSRNCRGLQRKEDQ